jgi:hypothetical protein
VANRSSILAFVFAASVGCSPEAEKPPPPTCANCGTSDPGIIGGVPPIDGSGGAAGDSGSGDTPVRLEGEVRILNDIAAFAAALFMEPAELLVEGQNDDVRGRWTGLEPTFVLDGVQRAPATWAQATPGVEALRTLQPINTLSPNSAGVVTTVLTVVRTSELDAAFASLTMPITRDQTRAQAILVALKDKQPASGVRVTVLGVESVIYLDNGAFSDAATVTDRSGMFLLANVPAVPWPGTGVVVTLSGAVTGRFDLRLVTGGVTLGGVGN